MRVLLFTQDDPIYVRELFDELANVDRTGIELVGVVVAPAMGKRTLVALVRQMWDFYGPIDFVRMGFRFVITKIGARLPAGLRAGRNFSIEQAAAAIGVPVRHVANLNDARFVETIRRDRIDVVASIAAPQIFKAALIAAPRVACINIHNAKLPHYRGMLPNFWQMLDGKAEIGATVHRISEGIDEGAILQQTTTPVRPGESLDSVIKRTKREGAHFLFKALRALANGTVVDQPPSTEPGCYHSFPTRADVAEFRRRGYRLL